MMADLLSRTMHPDEANQAFTVGRILETDSSVYNPADHHGPTLHYAAAAIQRAAGVRDTAHLDGTLLRATPLLFAVLTLVFAERLLARFTPNFAATSRKRTFFARLILLLPFLTLPGLWYYATDFIQEALLGCFIAGLAWSFTRKGLLRAVCVGLFAGLAFATKETSVLSFAALTAAAGMAGLLPRPRRTHLAPALLALGTFFVVSAAVFTGGFTDPGAMVRAFIDAPLAYLGRAVGDAANTGAAWHVHPWYWYATTCFGFTFTGGLPLAVLFIAVLWAHGGWKMLSKPMRVAAVYPVALFLLYSLIPYKTPWCMLTVLEALAFAVAFLLYAEPRERPASRTRAKSAAPLFFTAVLFLATFAFQTEGVWRMSTLPEREAAPWDYATASPEVEQLAERVRRALVSEPAKSAAVILPREDTWPLPWYLRDVKDRVGYWEPGTNIVETLAALKDKPFAAIVVPMEDGHLAQGLFPALARTTRHAIRNGVKARVFTR